MRYEELPESIKRLVDKSPGSDVPFYPQEVPEVARGDFILLEQITAQGALAVCSLLKPTTFPADVGMGNGFSTLAEAPVFSDIEEALEGHQGSIPVDQSLTFYRLNALPCYAVKSALAVQFADDNLIEPKLTIEVDVETSTGKQAAGFKLVDFPRFPIIDHARSPALWRVFEVPGLPSVYLPNPLRSVGIVSRIDARPAVDIVRDSICPHLIFIRKSALVSLRQAGVTGPDYSALSVSAFN